MDHAISAPQDRGGHDVIRVGALTIRFLVTGDDSGGSVAVFELTVPAGERLNGLPHSHAAYEETVYGLTGVLTWTVDATAHDVHPGQALCIRRGMVHRFENGGAETATVLCIASPAAIGPAFFREVAAVLDAARGGPPDRASILEVYDRYGLVAAVPH
jgi:quercetin dioxygenase-like cupin family protein